MRYTRMPSPIGELLLTGSDHGLTSLTMEQHAGNGAVTARLERDDASFAAARSQLEDYFAGRRLVFDLPVAASGSEFQAAVWDELRRIPYGQTVTYAELARRVDRPGAVERWGWRTPGTRWPSSCPIIASSAARAR